MSVDYRVELTIGDQAWTVIRDDDPDPTLEGGVLLAPMSVGWKMPNTNLWPAQPDPTTARFSILFASAQEAAWLDIGNPVHLQIFAGVMAGLTPLPSVRLAGRVAQKAGRPVHAAGLAAWRVDLVVSDYYADLAETDVAGVIPFQGLGTRDWIACLFDLEGIQAPGWNTGGDGDEQLVVDLGTIKSGTLSAAADRYLRTHADAGDFTDEEDRTTHELWLSQGWRRGVIRANLGADGTPNAIVPWRIEWITKRNVSEATDYTSYPAKFDEIDGSGLYGIVVAPPPSGVTDLTCAVDAGYVEFAATWIRTKNTTPNKIIVTNNIDEEQNPDWRRRVAAVPSETPIVARITDCLAVSAFNARFVAEMYLPETSTADRDAVDKFTWRASKDPAWPMLPSWFPDAGTWCGFGTPILVHGITPSQSPVSDAGFYPGVLDQVEFTISGGEFRFEFALRPGAPRPGGGPDEKVLTLADLAPYAPNPVFAGVDIEDLDPTRNRIADYRLVRSVSIDNP